MSLYLINYDLNGNKDYEKLFNAIIKMTDQYARPLKSMWIIRHGGNAYDIAVELCKHIDSDDGLIVSKLTPDSAWTQSFGEATTKWIKENY